MQKLQVDGTRESLPSQAAVSSGASIDPFSVACGYNVSTSAVLTLSWPAVSHSTHLTGGPRDRGMVVAKLSLQWNTTVLNTQHSPGGRFKVHSSV